MLPVLPIANDFIKAAKEGKVKFLTPMKLQKLMYFLYGEYYAETGTPLFSESFQAWKYGPVLSSVYQEFKEYGYREIDNYSTDALGNVVVISRSNPQNSSYVKVFDRICRKYKGFTGVELSELTHESGTPWAETLANGLISPEKIKIYFEKHRVKES